MTHCGGTQLPPRVVLEVGSTPTCPETSRILGSDDFHVVGCEAHVSQGAQHQVCFRQPQTPFAAAFDVVIYHALGVQAKEGLQPLFNLWFRLLQPNGRFYFYTLGSYSGYSFYPQDNPAAKLASSSTPYAFWLPEATHAQIVEEWHTIPMKDEPSKGVPLQVVMGCFQKPYQLLEDV